MDHACWDRRRLTMKCLTCTMRRHTSRESLLGLQEVLTQPWPQLLLTDTGQAALRTQGLIGLGRPKDKHCLLSRCSHARANTAGSFTKQADHKLAVRWIGPPTLSSRGETSLPHTTCARAVARKTWSAKKAAATTSLSCSFQKGLLKVPALSPQFSSQDGRLPFSVETSIWERSLTLGTDLIATAASGLWCPHKLCPPSPAFLLRASVLTWQPFPSPCPHTCMAAEHRQASHTRSPPALFSREAVVTHRQGSSSPLTAPPASANLCCIHTTCHACTKPECTNTDVCPFVRMLHPFSPM